MEAPLSIIEAMKDLVNRAYQQGWDDRGEANQAEEKSTTPAQAVKAIPMTSEVDESLPYRERFFRGTWPTDVSNEVKALPFSTLNLDRKVRNAVCVAIVSNGDSWDSLKIGEILKTPPCEIMKDIRVRRSLGEKGIRQLLDELGRFGIALLYPSV